MANRWGNSDRLSFLASKITACGDCSHEIKRGLLLGRKVMTNLDCKLKNRDIANKGPSSQSYGFSSSYVQICELDRKESWRLKIWHFWTVVLEKTFERPLDSKKIKAVNPKGNQPWIFIGRTHAKAQYFGHLMRRADSLEKTLMIGKIEGRRWRGASEDEMIGWHQPIQWTWVWANSGRWWWTGKPGMLQSMESQRDGYDLATEQWQHTLCVCLVPIVTHDHWHESPNPCSLVVNGI